MQDQELTLQLAYTVIGDGTTQEAPAYRFRMLLRGHSEPVGGIELRLGNSRELKRFGGQVGFAVGEEFRGRRLAPRSLRLLMPLARRHGFRELWITCNPDNLASRRSCEYAGAIFHETVDLPADHPMYSLEQSQKCRYRLDLGGRKGHGSAGPNPT